MKYFNGLLKLSSWSLQRAKNVFISNSQFSTLPNVNNLFLVNPLDLLNDDGGGGGSGMSILTASGNFDVPAGITSVYVVVYGGGGGGGAKTSLGGGGGGGGASAAKVCAVTPLESVPCVVGLGGTTNNSGGMSYFRTAGTCMAVGGFGGNTDGSGIGASGGLASSCIGDSTFDGGNGGNAVGVVGGGGGGSGRVLRQVEITLRLLADTLRWGRRTWRSPRLKKQ
jgi:hypothetical protein